MKKYRCPSYFLLFILTLICAREGLASFSEKFLQVQGKVGNVLVTDLNNDGLKQIIVLHTAFGNGEPSRMISVFWQDKTGLREEFTQTWEFDARAVMFDIAQVDKKSSGPDIVFGTAEGFFYYQRKGRNFSTVPQELIRTPSLFLYPDKQAVRHWKMFEDINGNGREDLIVPCFGYLKIYYQDENSNFSLGARINIKSQSEVNTRMDFSGEEVEQARNMSLEGILTLPLFYFLHISSEKRKDMLIIEDEHLNIYLQDERGEFAKRPHQKINLAGFFDKAFTMDEEIPLVKTPASFWVKGVDINQDGLDGVMLARTKMKGLDAISQILIFYNQAGRLEERPGWNYRSSGILTQPEWTDLNADGRLDLAVFTIEIGYGALIKTWLFKSMTGTYEYFFCRENGRLGHDPEYRQKIDFKTDIARGKSSRGYAGSFSGDFDGNGRVDMWIQTVDNEVLIYKNEGGRNMFSSRPFIKLSTQTSFKFILEDLNNDGITDIIFYYKEIEGYENKLCLLLSSSRTP